MGRPKIINPHGDTKWINVLASADVHRAFVELAEQRQVKTSVVVREALDEYLVRHSLSTHQ